MRWLPWILLVAMLSPFIPVHAQLPASVGDQAPPGPETGQRVFVLTMEGTRFNGMTWPNTPLLEAYVGETMTVVVHVPQTAEAHTFHMHGHPWWDPEVDRFIDTKLLFPGDTHSFSVEAGTIQGNAGDWFYHCHVDGHFAGGMWGILRVYPFSTTVEGPLDDLTVTVDRKGEPVPETSLSLTLDGAPISADIQRVEDGRFTVSPDLPPDADGQLVIRAENELGQSVARLDVQDGSYDLIRHVIPDQAPELLGDHLPASVADDADLRDPMVQRSPSLLEATP